MEGFHDLSEIFYQISVEITKAEEILKFLLFFRYISLLNQLNLILIHCKSIKGNSKS